MNDTVTSEQKLKHDRNFN